MQYKEYLKTEHWQKTRQKFKANTFKRCYLCRTKNGILDVHHKRYSREGKSILFKEKHTDFRLLCRRCHFKIHELKLTKELAGNLLKRRIIRDIVLGRIKVVFKAQRGLYGNIRNNKNKSPRYKKKCNRGLSTCVNYYYMIVLVYY